MKLEASKQKFKKSFILSLLFSVLYSSPLLAVDYVYDKTKLTDDEIIRLKKLRDRNSEYWKDDLFRLDVPKETGLRHDIEGQQQEISRIQFFISQLMINLLILTKRSLFLTALIHPATRLLSCRDLALKKEMAIRKNKLNNLSINLEQD
ncbi:TPA: hypothetical protein ACSS3U_000797 [Neisseria meningitidis]